MITIFSFGLKHKGYNNAQNGRVHKYKYNGKEYQDELGLKVTAMDFCQYDPALDRFNSIDRLSEMTYPVTPYRFAFNNPVVFTDPGGLSEQSGNDLTGWVKTGNSVFWYPNVNNQDDIDRLFSGKGYEYVPDYSVVTDANSNNLSHFQNKTFTLASNKSNL